MTAARRGQAPPKEMAAPGRPGGRENRSGESGTAKRSGGRPPFQGKSGNARNSSQRPPQWRKPKGYDGFAELEHLYGRPTKPFKERE
jgi:hypothetical protein